MFKQFRHELSRRLGSLRRVSTQTFKPDEVNSFRFYQFRPSTAKFFVDRLARTDVRIADTPHLAFAAALESGSPTTIDEAREFYRDYLQASWGRVPAEDIEKRIKRFLKHFAHHRERGSKARPVITRIGNDYFVVDGNHRTAFGVALGRTVECEVWSMDLVYRHFARSQEFYGTGNRGIPYQTVYFRGEAIVPGRRSDTAERLSMVPRELLAGTSILDVASNIGMSSIMAVNMGAGSALGLEISQPMVWQAVRSAMFEDVYPKAQFRQFDLDQDKLSPNELYDTAFMFSIYTHLKNPQVLHEIARSHVRKGVVFEGHPGTSRSDYAAFFDSGLFSRVEELGRLRVSVFKEERSRPLWACFK